MSMVQRLRGQPLVALLAVLAGWMGGRISAWDNPLPMAGTGVQAMRLSSADGTESAGLRETDMAPGPQSPPGAGFYPASAYGPMPGQNVPYPVFVKVPVRVESPRRWYSGQERALPEAPSGAAYGATGELPFATGPTRFLAGIPDDTRLPAGLPPFSQFAAQPYPSSSASPVPVIAPMTRSRRWSVDSWALLRQDGTGPLANGALPATYGASQAGAVLRYRLSPGDARQWTGYMRTTATLGTVMRETAAALGVSARPLPGLPVIAALEGRLTEQGGARRIQPVAMAVTQLPYFALPGGLRGEAYVQAGYVAGRFATPFADGQFRVDRALFSLGKAEARLGGGLWGGAQKGAGRLDAGPSASLALPLGKGLFGRAAVDWRFRVAGDADPGSGPALTLSAGF
ncbi:hypothetical protein [Novosphingobium sp.]|jgi:hypothetical protein|uniref:hypothetical protein n=1 Tax=Novosphingobium sp. TaxID=1874826 RepID=UPI002FE40C25